MCCLGKELLDTTLRGVQYELSKMHSRLRHIERLVDRWARDVERDIDSEPEDWMSSMQKAVKNSAKAFTTRWSRAALSRMFRLLLLEWYLVPWCCIDVYLISAFESDR